MDNRIEIRICAGCGEEFNFTFGTSKPTSTFWRPHSANDSDEMYFISNSEAVEMGIKIWDENRDEMISKGITRLTR